MSKTYYRNISGTLLIGLFFLVSQAGAQTPDSIHQKEIKYFEQKLAIDEGKAVQVAFIKEGYATTVKNVMNDKSLNDKYRRTQIDRLIAIKNNQLAAILSAAQLNRIIASTERKKNADSLKQKQIEYLSRKLLIDEQKAGQVIDINETFKDAVNSQVRNSNMTAQDKRTRMSDLTMQKNVKLAAILTPAQMERLSPTIKKVDTVQHPQAPSKEIIAVQDTFERKLKALVTNTKLSEPDRRAQISLILKERNDNILKIHAKHAAAGIRQQATKS